MKPRFIGPTQREWNIRLTREQVITLDALCGQAVDALLSHSGESGVVPMAQRIVLNQIRDIREKWLS